MKKVWDVIKKFFIWLGAIFVGIMTVLLCRKKPVENSAMEPSDDREIEEIERKAELRKKEISNRIRNTTASDLTAGYPAVRGAIDEGIDRFRERCSGNKSRTDS